MGSLIKNELIKTFRKKSIYIVLIILIAFMILTNIIYKNLSSFMGDTNYSVSEQYIQYVNERLNEINVATDREEYIQLKTDLDFYELYKKYDKDSWQVYILKRDFYGYINNINIAKYGTAADKELLVGNPEEIYNKELEKLNNNDWKQYVNEEIKKAEEELTVVKAEKQAKGDVSDTREIDDMIKTLELKIELSKMRLERDIPYGTNFMNEAIETRLQMANIDSEYDEPNLKYEEKYEKQMAIETLEKSKYVIETGKDVNNMSTLRGVLLNSFDEYSIFLIIFAVMIAGGMISSEMEKGTIKMLLVKPYKRSKILLAKYLVSMLMILFSFVVTILLEIIIGGIIFGFDSLSIPAVVYDFSTNSIQEYNVFTYVLILGLTKLPIYILMGTLAFAISCIFSNTVLAIVLPIIGNIAGAIINQLIMARQIKELAFMPTLNWDLSQFLFGHLPKYQHTNMGFAIGLCISYLVIMIIGSCIAFNKKEIKNV